ncbi:MULTISPECIES: LysR substrate-binding domain-containing protein [unclassified Thalassospira]|uniref:LysR substrate-binding domain-containing protein n=1 Tax=unclassified Thalassospira TaxID=2648997 RepID=UPI0025E268E0|nr:MULTISPECIES: LysR substrate-binding domain-containing protein [unclassified Thalassospira]|tara:strand:+ start:92 stop:1015 length:924 start_codon:yes stop_codon:yes gene_type:complete
MAAQPSIKQLKYLVALSETGHFGRAAEACFITQPSLSAAISELENLLGAQLVERNKRQVLMTPLGQEVVSRARSILQEVDELTTMAQAASDPLSGPIHIGVIPTIGPYLLPDVMSSLKAGFPKLQPLLREDQTAKLIELLMAGKLDIALIALPIDENWLEEFELFEDRFVFACAPNNPLTHKKHLEIGDIKDEKLLLLEDGHCLRDQALEVCHKAGWSKSADFQANSLSTLVQMVGAGIGATLLPEMSLEVEARRPDLLKIIPFKNPVPIRRIGMVWRRSSARKSEYRQLAAYLRDRLAPRDEAVVA